MTRFLSKRWPLPLLAALLQFLTTSTRYITSDIAVANNAAWQFLRHGNPYVPHGWITPGTADEYHLIHGHWIADRMPGMILTLAPFQWTKGPPGIIGVMIVGALATFATVYLAYELWGTHAAILLCIGTPLLAMNKEVWPQTLIIPAMLAALYVIVRTRHEWLTAPLVFYVFTLRPPFGVCLAAVLAVYAYPRLRIIAYSLAGIILGAATLLLWTHAYFGYWSLIGGYAIDGHHHVPLAHSLYVGFLSPQRGILFYTPWAVVLFDRMVNTRYRIILFLLLAYTVAEWQQYNAFGGDGFLSYRYPLPFIVMLVPLLVDTWNRFYATLMAWTVGLNAFVFLFDKLQWHNPTRNPNYFPTGGIMAYFNGLIVGILTVVAILIISAFIARWLVPLGDDELTYTNRFRLWFWNFRRPWWHGVACGCNNRKRHF